MMSCKRESLAVDALISHPKHVLIPLHASLRVGLPANFALLGIHRLLQLAALLLQLRWLLGLLALVFLL